MSFYWFWEDVSPVHRLRDEYNELIEDLDDEIKNINTNITNIGSQVNAIHKTLKSYSLAKGCMAELYYQKIEKSESKYRDILSSCKESLEQVKSKRALAVGIRDRLQHYYGIEQREEKKFELWEISI